MNKQVDVSDPNDLEEASKLPARHVAVRAGVVAPQARVVPPGAGERRGEAVMIRIKECDAEWTKINMGSGVLSFWDGVDWVRCKNQPFHKNRGKDRR
jgi:hypothetical protein